MVFNVRVTTGEVATHWLLDRSIVPKAPSSFQPDIAYAQDQPARFRSTLLLSFALHNQHITLLEIEAFHGDRRFYNASKERFSSYDRCPPGCSSLSMIGA